MNARKFLINDRMYKIIPDRGGKCTGCSFYVDENCVFPHKREGLIGCARDEVIFEKNTSNRQTYDFKFVLWDKYICRNGRIVICSKIEDHVITMDTHCDYVFTVDTKGVVDELLEEHPLDIIATYQNQEHFEGMIIVPEQIKQHKVKKHEAEKPVAEVNNEELFNSLPELYEYLSKGEVIERIVEGIKYKLGSDCVLWLSNLKKDWAIVNSCSITDYKLFKKVPKEPEWYETNFKPIFCWVGEDDEDDPTAKVTVSIITSYDKHASAPFISYEDCFYVHATPLTLEELTARCWECE